MIGEAAALAAIWEGFADPEPIIYTQAGVELPSMPAIRSDIAAPTFDGPGATLRSIIYEVQHANFPARPTKSDSFTHRGHRWRVEDVSRRDDVGAWELTVVDGGPAT